MFILENERTKLISMKDVEHLNYSINRHLKTIREKFDGEKIKECFQLLSQYSVVHPGVSFMSNKTMAKLLKVSERSVRRYTKAMESLRIILRVPTFRKKNNSQTSNSFIILPVLRACPGGCPPMNHSFESLKQERDYYYKDKSENPQDEKINQYVANRVKDAIKKGVTIKCLSSYVDKIFRSIERQALIAAEIEKNKKLQAENKRRQEIFREAKWEAAAKTEFRKPDASKDELNELGIF